MKTVRGRLALLWIGLLVVTAQPAPAQNVSAAVAPAGVTSGEDGSAAKAPVSVVEQLHAALLEAMMKAEQLGFDGRYELLRPVLAETFDLAFCGEKVVGSHWKTLSAEEQTRWVEKFGRLMTANYAGRFTGYGGESFHTVGEQEAPHDTRLVLTRLAIPSNDDVQLNYRLIQTAGVWRIIDVYLNGNVSELSLRRSEYSTTLKRDGFEKLAASIDDKIAELSKKRGGE